MPQQGEVFMFQEIASIATIGEAFFVALSVIFIWYQLRTSNRLAQAANSQNLFELSSPLLLQFIEDKQVAELWLKGAHSFSELDKVDQYRYDMVLTWWLNLHENIYYQYRQKLLDEPSYRAWANELTRFVKTQRLRPLWEQLKESYQPDFQKRMEEFIAQNQ